MIGGNCMYTEIDSLVHSLIGVLPPELNFVYGFCDIFLFIVLIMCIIMPFFFVYQFISNRW